MSRLTDEQLSLIDDFCRRPEEALLPGRYIDPHLVSLMVGELRELRAEVAAAAPFRRRVSRLVREFKVKGDDDGAAMVEKALEGV